MEPKPTEPQQPLKDSEPQPQVFKFTQPDKSVVEVQLPKHIFNVFTLTIAENQGRNDGRLEGFLADPEAFGPIFLHILTTVARQPDARDQLDMILRELDHLTSGLTATLKSELSFSDYRLDQLQQTIVAGEPLETLQCAYHDSFSGELLSYLYFIPSDDGYTYCHTVPTSQSPPLPSERPTEGLASLAYQDIHMPWAADFAIANTDAWKLLVAMLYNSYTLDTDYSQHTKYSTATLKNALAEAYQGLEDRD